MKKIFLKYKKRRRHVLIGAVEVSNNFIRRAIIESIPVTPLKLQKLVYFLYKDYLKKTGNRLFTEQFETWKYGPVVPSIYTEFREYGNNPIESFAQDSQGNSFMIAEKGAFKDSLDFVWDRYKLYSGEALSEMTHKDGTAWSKAKANENYYLNDGDIQDEQDL